MYWQRVCEWIFDKFAPREETPAAVTAEPQQETLGNIILAQLLLELPEHQQACSAAWQANDLEQLGRCIHKLAGAVAYCDLPELSASLAGLRQKLQSGDSEHLGDAFIATSRSMTALMESTGTDPA